MKQIVRQLLITAMFFIPCGASIIFAHAQIPTIEPHHNKLVLTHPHEVQEVDAKQTPIQSTLDSLDDAHFLSAIKGNAVVIEAYANWCGSCREMAPVIEALAKRHPNIKFYRVDIDSNQMIVDRCDLKFVPTLVLFHRGIMIGSLVGGDKSDKTLDAFVEHGNGVML